MRKANGHRRINGGGFRRLMLRPWTSRKPAHGRAIHVDLVHMALVVRFFLAQGTRANVSCCFTIS